MILVGTNRSDFSKSVTVKPLSQNCNPQYLALLPLNLRSFLEANRKCNVAMDPVCYLCAKTSAYICFPFLSNWVHQTFAELAAAG